MAIFLPSIVYSQKLIELTVGKNDIYFFRNIRAETEFYEQVSNHIINILHILDEDMYCDLKIIERNYVFSLWFTLGKPINGLNEEIASYIADEVLYVIYWRIFSKFYHFPYKSKKIVEISMFRTRNNYEGRDIKYHIARVCTMPYTGEKLIPMNLCARWSEFYQLLIKNSFTNETNDSMLQTNSGFYLTINEKIYSQWFNSLFQD